MSTHFSTIQIQCIESSLSTINISFFVLLKLTAPCLQSTVTLVLAGCSSDRKFSRNFRSIYNRVVVREEKQ